MSDTVQFIEVTRYKTPKANHGLRTTPFTSIHEPPDSLFAIVPSQWSFFVVDEDSDTNWKEFLKWCRKNLGEPSFILTGSDPSNQKRHYYFKVRKIYKSPNQCKWALPKLGFKGDIRYDMGYIIVHNANEFFENIEMSPMMPYVDSKKLREFASLHQDKKVTVKAAGGVATHEVNLEKMVPKALERLKKGELLECFTQKGGRHVHVGQMGYILSKRYDLKLFEDFMDMLMKEDESLAKAAYRGFVDYGKKAVERGEDTLSRRLYKKHIEKIIKEWGKRLYPNRKI